MAGKKGKIEQDAAEVPRKSAQELQAAAKKEFARLKRLYQKKGDDGKWKLAIDKNKYDALIGLMRQTAFMSAQLDDLAEQLYYIGVTETYQNGDNQFGTKESTQSKAYNTIIKNYITAIKTLADCTPEAEIKDELFEFIQQRQRGKK